MNGVAVMMLSGKLTINIFNAGGNAAINNRKNPNNVFTFDGQNIKTIRRLH